MSTYQFTIFGNNKPLQCNADGSGTITFAATDYIIPAGKLPSGLPGNLSDLIQQVGANNVTVDYYVSALGMVSGYDCIQTISLYATGKLSDGTSTSPVQVAQSQGSDGGPVPQTWYPLTTGANQLLTQLSSNSIARGSGSGCRFEWYGGWSKTQILVNTVVSVDLTQYCKNYPQICSQTPPSPGSPPIGPVSPPAVPSTFKKYWWLFLIVAIVFIILIILLIVLFSKKND